MWKPWPVIFVCSTNNKDTINLFRFSNLQWNSAFTKVTSTSQYPLCPQHTKKRQPRRQECSLKGLAVAFWSTEHLKLSSYTLCMQLCSTVFSPIISHYPAAFPPFTMSTWTTQNYKFNCSLTGTEKLIFSSVDLVKLIHGPQHCCSSKMHHIFSQ